MAGFLKGKWNWVGVALVICLIIIVLFFIANKPWVADYWEHKAVLLELFRHPANPEHPIVNVKSPHAFYSPYFVALAYMGRFLAVAPDQLLDIISLINLLLFICSVRLLERLIIKGENQSKSFVLLLLALLFLWGIFPPYYSSFYHFISLFYTIAYPATFAFCLTILSAFLADKILKSEHGGVKQLGGIVLCVFLNWVVLLTHPLTFVFCFSLYLYVYIQNFQAGNRSSWTLKSVLYKAFGLSLFFCIPIMLAPFWTYYSLWDLFLKRGVYGRFHSDSEILYQGVMLSYYTLLIPLGLILYSLSKRQKQAYVIFIIVALLLFIYFFAYVSGYFGYGRSISFIAIWLQLWVVFFLQKQEDELYRKRIIRLVVLTAMPFVLLSVKAIVNAAATTHSDYLRITTSKNFTATKKSIPSMTHRLFFLKNHVKDGETIMADIITSRYVAAFGGKAIASPYSDYWIMDNETRMADIKTFFEGKDTLLRIILLYKYKPQYLLLNTAANGGAFIVPNSMINGAIITKNGYTLIRLRF